MSTRLRARRASIRSVILLGALAVGGCATSAAPSRVGPSRVDFARLADSIVSTPPLHRAHIGIEVYDPATRRVLYERNSERHFVPASNQKLWVTSTALHELGPEWRYRTPILGVGLDSATGAAQAIVVVGQGDPTWSERFYPEPDSAETRPDSTPRPPRDPRVSYRRELAVLDSLADSLVARGLRRIAGDLIIDASFFDDAIIPGTWTYGNLNGTSAPPTGAFVVAEGIMRVRVLPGPVMGAPAVIEPLASAGVVRVLNQVTTAEQGARRRISDTRGPWDDTLRLSGSIGVDDEGQTLRLPMTDPVFFAAHAFADALRARGVTIEGSVRVVRDSAEAMALRDGRLGADGPPVAVREMTSWTSPPLSEIVHGILAPSQNWIAEQLVRTLGGLKRGDGSWRAGINVETTFLFDVVGIDSSALRLQDGSGMSHQNLVTPHAVVQLFDYARTAPWSDVWHAALAKPADDGTLRNRLRQLEGRLAGKTGTLSSVNALSGYVRTADGRQLIFSILSNASGLGGDPVVDAIDLMVDALANGVAPRE